MELFVGLDISVKEPSLCVIAQDGQVVEETRVASAPEAVLSALAGCTAQVKRIGLEAGPLSQWISGGLAEAGLPVIWVETGHMKGALSAQRNKTDRHDARGIAQMMRVGLYRAVHVKTLRGQERRMLLTRTSRCCALKSWGMRVARRRGMKKAIVAAARRLAVVLHRMWSDGTASRSQAVATA